MYLFAFKIMSEQGTPRGGGGTTGKRRSRYRFAKTPEIFVRDAGDACNMATADFDESTFHHSPLAHFDDTQSVDPGPALLHGMDTFNPSFEPETLSELQQYVRPGAVLDMFADEPIDEDNSEGEHEAGEVSEVHSENNTSSARGEADSVLIIANWRVLWSILMTTGSRKLTKAQYQAMRIVLDAFSRISRTGIRSWKSSLRADEELRVDTTNISSLPHFATLSQMLKPKLFQYLTVRASDSNERVDLRKAGARAKTYSDDGFPLIPVRTVLPSEYARADVATAHIFDLMCSTSLSHAARRGINCNCPSVQVEECIDVWPVVAARELFYGPIRRVSVDSTDDQSVSALPLFAEPGDTLSVTFLGCTDITATIAARFCLGVSPNGYGTLVGDVSAIWSVHHISRKDNEDYKVSIPSELSERDQNIIRLFSFVDYRSPSDDVNVDVPDIPVEDEQDSRDNDGEDILDSIPGIRKKRKMSTAMREAMRSRRDALKKQKQQVERAWIEWVKPILKPGDTLCLLRPRVSRPCDAGDRIILVYRFWVENEERRRHILCMSGSQAIPDSFETCADSEIRSFFRPFTEFPVDTNRDVIKCELRNVHSGPRGLEKFSPISSYGTLDNGETYFVYRFMLFWDGFEVAKGKSASGEGIYMVCLNLPSKARSSPNAVRIISLCPPGVKSASIFKKIEEDIVTGMTDGFPDYDAKGRRCRIFLDLVGYLGDTPAVNASLDVLGHTANACCHLCNYTKKSTCPFGSLYAGEGTFGLLTGTGRNFFTQSAVRDCQAQKRTCALLGLKPPSSDSELPLHALRLAMMKARDRVPITSDGARLLTGLLDPYQACFIAPDHLLTAHLRDCVNLAFKLLPNTQCRSLAEKYMIGYSNDLNLPTQNRLFDMEKKVLFSMSMTELYSLSLVAELSFANACKAMESEPNSTTSRRRASPNCGEAISLVGSACRLIAAMWRFPSSEHDPPSTIMSFNYKNGMRYIARLQALVQRHVSQLRSLCRTSIEDLQALEEDTVPRELRAEILRQHSACLLARRCVDKPNIHRLMELAFTTLPMVGHVSRVGELVLEKRHQSLKRAIRQGNNKDNQLLAMSSAVFNDWEGRLNLQMMDAINGSYHATLGCFRLLAGREAIYTTNAQLSDVARAQVLTSLGPVSCVPAFLQTNHRSIVSMRALPNFHADISWSLTVHREVVLRGRTSHIPKRQWALTEFRHACRFQYSTSDFVFADEIQGTTKTGVSVLSLQIGNVIEMLCHKPCDISFHTPFVVHRHSAGTVLSTTEGKALWAVSALFSRKTGAESIEFWAAMRPCHRLPDVLPIDGFYRYNFRHYAAESLSFAKIGFHMRPTAVLHDCDPAICRPVLRRQHISHTSCTILDKDAIFFILSRPQGYPPRRG